jgi:hypothetical protein
MPRLLLLALLLAVALAAVDGGAVAPTCTMMPRTDFWYVRYPSLSIARGHWHCAQPAVALRH